MWVLLGKFVLGWTLPALQITQLFHFKVTGSYPLLCIRGSSGLFVRKWFFTLQIWQARCCVYSCSERDMQCCAIGHSGLVLKCARYQGFHVAVGDDFNISIFEFDEIRIRGMIVGFNITFEGSMWWKNLLDLTACERRAL